MWASRILVGPRAHVFNNVLKSLVRSHNTPIIPSRSPLFSIMVGVSMNLGHGALSAKRAQFAGLPGIAGLFSNLHVLAIAVFASLGGFVYGCMFPSS